MDVETLRRAWEAGKRHELMLFWGHKEVAGVAVGPWVLSQWWPAGFTVDGQLYTTAEHWMMAEKARLFEDREALDAILVSPSPREAKAWGRKVRGFEAARWEAHRNETVVRGNVEKFGQNEDIRKFLLDTGDRILVEASPYDRVWGIGLRATDPRALDPRTWRGANLLGFALGEARVRLT